MAAVAIVGLAAAVLKLPPPVRAGSRARRVGADGEAAADLDRRAAAGPHARGPGRQPASDRPRLGGAYHRRPRRRDDRWAYVVHGIGFGWTGIVISGWPPVGADRRHRGAGAHDQALAELATDAAPTVLAHAAPADSAHAAQLALAASVAAGNPLSQRAVMARFGLSRAAERTVRQASSPGRTGTDHERHHPRHLDMG